MRPGPWRLAATSLVVAGVWTSRELIMGSWPYGGFPWGRIGMSQSESPLAVVTSWVGVAGLTFLMVLVVALAIEAVRVMRVRRTVGWWALTAPALLLIALILLPQFPTANAGSFRVVAVQGNGPTAYLDQGERYDVLDAQLQATEEAVGVDPDLVVWPEGGVGLDPLDDANAAAVLDRATRMVGAPILLNAAVPDGDLVFNRSMLWTAGGVEQSHDKRYPVPFGEYVPDRGLYEKIVPSLIGMIGREYEPGTDFAPVMDIDGVQAALALCFDVLFDQHIEEGISGGAQVLIFQTNNADFRGTDENLRAARVRPDARDRVRPQRGQRLDRRNEPGDRARRHDDRPDRRRRAGCDHRRCRVARWHDARHPAGRGNPRVPPVDPSRVGGDLRSARFAPTARLVFRHE